MNNEDRELFDKTNKKSIISLPYKFSYSGWECCLLSVKSRDKETPDPFDLSSYEYYVSANSIHRIDYGTSGIRQYYKKGTTLENCIKQFKKLLNETNRKNIEKKATYEKSN